MTDIKENFEELAEKLEEMVDELKGERDELYVRLHLAKMETSDEWQELERKWSKLQAKMKKVANATAETSEDVAAAARLLGAEIRAGFKRIARQL
ncbi:MAG: hypothetical protein OEY72_09040 [Gammaproteobacteria bacterium]|nr:hypothetical protein [Gammaproteobacteria bacterium]